MSMQRATTCANSLSVSAKISLGFLIVLILHISIALLGHYGLSKAQRDLETYGKLDREVEQFHQIDRLVAALQRNVLLFAFTGYEGPEHRAKELQSQLEALLEKAAHSDYLKEREAVQEMQAHLVKHQEIFAAVAADRAKRRRLVDEGLQQHVDRFEQGLLALEENPRIEREVTEASAAFTAAQLNILKFVNGPDSTYFRQAKNEMAETRRHLLAVREVIGAEENVTLIAMLDSVDAYEAASIQMVQATRSYLHLVNVVLAGESVEFRRLATDIREEQDLRVGQLAETMTEDNRHFQFASNMFSVITIVLGVVAAWLIGKDVVPPLDAIATTFDRLAKGERIESIPAMDRSDELGRLAHAAQVFKEKANETERLLAVAEESQDELNSVNQELAKQSALAEKMAQDATAATVAKSEFLANMSHEIRTPMTAILGFAETVAETTKDEETRQSVETIQRNGEHLLSIINDILDLSKVESGKLSVEMMSASPYTVVSEVISLVQVKADGAGLKLSSRFMGKVPKSIHTDPTRLRQILINLLGNAIKFTEIGGISLQAELIQRDGRAVMQFDVIDSGIGMTDEQLARLFQPFSQADTSTTRRFGGTGLGLTISKRLANMLGGDLTVAYSRPGEGTSFRLSVDAGPVEKIEFLDAPSSHALQQEKDEVDCEHVSLAGLRILLAEDGPDNQRLLKFVLNKADADVTIVANGQEAVDAAMAALEEGSPFDCVLMDMQMPVLDGYQATQTLRERGYCKPILALTAHAMEREKKKCLNSGCDDFLSKPIDRKRMLLTVCHWSRSATCQYECPLSSSCQPKTQSQIDQSYTS